MIKQDIKEHGLVADFFTDPDHTMSQALIMLGGSEGGKSWSRARRPIEALVRRGYAVLSLAYFRAEGLPGALQEIPLSYFQRAFDWLGAQPGVASDEVVILGGSKGAEAALVLASRDARVKAVVAFAPSSVVWQGVPANRFALNQDVRSSWACNGMGLPFLAYPTPIKKRDLILLRLREMHVQALRQIDKAAQAAIPIEKSQAALLLISGKRDRLWPATRMAEQVVARLQARGFTRPVAHLALDCGHNALIRNRDCWRKIFTFLHECEG